MTKILINIILGCIALLLILFIVGLFCFISNPPTF